jgi:hypothetical protein
LYVGSPHAKDALQRLALLIDASETLKLLGGSGKFEFKLNVPFKQLVEEYMSISSTATTYTLFDPLTTPPNAPADILVEFVCRYVAVLLVIVDKVAGG